MKQKSAVKLNLKALLICDRAFLLISLAVVLIFLGGSTLEARAEGVDISEQQKLTSHLLINLFLDRVDKNELVLFNHVVSRSDLEAHQVSYVYNVADDSLIVRLCFNLQKKILVPKFENYLIDRITVETDKDGNINKVITHVSPLEKADSN